MASGTEPRRVVVDGVDMVLLEVREYERLLAARRQAGAQAARIRSLRQQIEQMRERPPDNPPRVH